ncbi:MAG: CapA family protein [Ruminococcaceae bacterium]|nr:CapA family protein [Oscillospiraceae bacterium]
MKILFGGDICFSYMPRDYDTSGFSTVVKSLKPLFNKADYRIANLECVLYDGEPQPIKKSGPALMAKTDFVSFLQELKINCAALANNHLGDHGAEAIEATTALLDKKRIRWVGAGANKKKAYSSAVFIREGISVSVLSVCENEFGTAGENTPGSAGFDLYYLIRRIKEERTIYDHCVVMFHGGNEQDPFPSPEKVKLYRFLAENGASAIIAGHTHCPQGYEIYNNVPIVYSLGNFYFPLSDEKEGDPDSPWNHGYLAMLDFKPRSVELSIHPYCTEVHGEYVELLEGDRLDCFMMYLEKLCKPLGDMDKIKELFDVWCTMDGVKYAKHAAYSPEMLSEQGSVVKIKNLFSCEAHNELMKNLFNLCYNGGFEEAQAKQNIIKELQTIKLDEILGM